jgi:putative Holliday junction resolvase
MRAELLDYCANIGITVTAKYKLPMLHDKSQSRAHGGVGVTPDARAFAGALPARGRLLGMDLGSKTIGLALSDVERSIASALVTVQRTKFAADAAELQRLAREHAIVGFVLGLPSHLAGHDGRRAQSTRAFAHNLSRLTPIPLLLWDERLSTVAAERVLIAADTSRRRRAQVIDKVAAAIILQNALDRMRHQAQEQNLSPISPS